MPKGTSFPEWGGAMKAQQKSNYDYLLELVLVPCECPKKLLEIKTKQRPHQLENCRARIALELLGVLRL